MPRYLDDPYDPTELKRLRLFLYLTPVVGVFPAVWTLLRRTGDRRERAVSRLVVTLGMLWLASYVALGAGTEISHATVWSMANALATSGYFGVNLWLMLRLWQRKPLVLPGISDLSDRLP
ncbi:hypothetical protein ACQ4M4_03495 [Leptolyngbya sp. AN02str]|uniref:hypothetical protein n=1 Tax=Leptolyngbya sp. AN02str TaxID=3423363 RepID=UPI003D31B517